MKNLSYKFLSRLLIAATIFLFAACGGGGSGSPTTYTVGGNLGGLTSGTLTIALNKTQTLNLTKDGNFTFQGINAGSAYAVTIVTQPVGQTCGFINNPAGQNISANITNIILICSQNTYTISGTVTGLTNGQIINLVDNDNITHFALVSGNSFTMSGSYITGQKYSIGLSEFNFGENCSFKNENGRIINSNVTNVQVTCTAAPPPTTYNISGTISAPGILFDNNASIKLNTDFYPIKASIPLTTNKKTFSFSNIIPGSDYVITIQNNSNSYVCSVNNNIGTNVTGNITDVQVVCSPTGYTLSVDTSNAHLGPKDILVIEDENYYNGQVVAAYQAGQIPATAELKNITTNSSAVIANGGNYQVVAFAVSKEDSGIDPNTARICTFDGANYISGTNVKSNVTITNMDCSITNP